MRQRVRELKGSLRKRSLTIPTRHGDLHAYTFFYGDDLKDPSKKPLDPKHPWEIIYHGFSEEPWSMVPFASASKYTNRLVVSWNGHHKSGGKLRINEAQDSAIDIEGFIRSEYKPYAVGSAGGSWGCGVAAGAIEKGASIDSLAMFAPPARWDSNLPWIVQHFMANVGTSYGIYLAMKGLNAVSRWLEGKLPEHEPFDEEGRLEAMAKKAEYHRAADPKRIRVRKNGKRVILTKVGAAWIQNPSEFFYSLLNEKHMYDMKMPSNLPICMVTPGSDHSMGNRTIKGSNKSVRRSRHVYDVDYDGKSYRIEVPIATHQLSENFGLEQIENMHEDSWVGKHIIIPARDHSFNYHTTDYTPSFNDDIAEIIAGKDAFMLQTLFDESYLSRHNLLDAARLKPAA